MCLHGTICSNLFHILPLYSCYIWCQKTNTHYDFFGNIKQIQAFETHARFVARFCDVSVIGTVGNSLVRKASCQCITYILLALVEVLCGGFCFIKDSHAKTEKTYNINNIYIQFHKR